MDDLECNLQISHVNQRPHRDASGPLDEIKSPTRKGPNSVEEGKGGVEDSAILDPKNIDETPYIRRRHNAKKHLR